MTASATKQRGSGRRVCFRIGGDPPPGCWKRWRAEPDRATDFRPIHRTNLLAFQGINAPPCPIRSQTMAEWFADPATGRFRRLDDDRRVNGTVNFVSYTGSSRKHWLQPASSQAGARLGRNPGRRTTGKPCSPFFVVCSGVMELKSVVKG